MDQDYWIKELEENEIKLGFSNGYRFVYGPWETLDKAEVAFLSLNPGRGKTLDNNTMRDISDERGNTYEVEQGTSKSPMVDQFLRLAALLGCQPPDILTGVVAPFRSHNWSDLEKCQKKRSLVLGRRFWEEPLSRPNLRLVIAIGVEVGELIVDITRAKPAGEACTGWGNTKLRRYRCSPQGKVVVQLPHLSRFKLLGREPSERKLRAFLDSALGGRAC